MKKPVRRLQVGGGALNCDGPALFPTRQPTPEGRHGRDPRRVPRRSGRGQGDPRRSASPRTTGWRTCRRATCSAWTEVGRQAKVFMESGRLVPDDLILAMVGERVRQPDVACLDPRRLPPYSRRPKPSTASCRGVRPSAPASTGQGRGLSHVIFFAVGGGVGPSPVGPPDVLPLRSHLEHLHNRPVPRVSVTPVAGSCVSGRTIARRQCERDSMCIAPRPSLCSVTIVPSACSRRSMRIDRPRRSTGP